MILLDSRIQPSGHRGQSVRDSDTTFGVFAPPMRDSCCHNQVCYLDFPYIRTAYRICFEIQEVVKISDTSRISPIALAMFTTRSLSDTLDS